MGEQVQIDLLELLVRQRNNFGWETEIYPRANQGEWANAARSMVSIFIRQSQTINLEMLIKTPSETDVAA